MIDTEYIMAYIRDYMEGSVSIDVVNTIVDEENSIFDKYYNEELNTVNEYVTSGTWVISGVTAESLAIERANSRIFNNIISRLINEYGFKYKIGGR